MPWTLYLYILRELIKLMALTVAVLVTMISFAAAIKPMSDGLLGAGAMIKFVGYSAPTMLGFALPFAGAFASTLVFIRMAADNEVLACSASGLSYAKILAPVAALGLVLTMGLFYLSNFVVPGFYKAAAETLENDLMSVLVTQLDQNRPFTEFPGLVIYADSAVQMPAPPNTGATRYIRLEGVAVGELDEQERVRTDSTAKTANILLFQDKTHGSRVTMKLLEAMRYKPDVGELEYSRSLSYGPHLIDNPFGDDPKFLSWPQLRDLDREPERFKDVREAKAELARQVAVAELRSLIREQLEAEQGERGVVLARERQDYLIKAPTVRMRSGVLILRAKQGQPITIEYPAGAPERRIQATLGSIEVRSDKHDVQPSVSIELRGGVSVFELPGSEPITEKQEDTLPPMRWPRDVIDDNIEEQPLEVLQAVANQHLGTSGNVVNAQLELDRNIKKLGCKITSQLHERAASAVTCLMLLVFGSVLAMHLKGQLPLVVFFWSFMLAIVSIIIIHTGQNLASSPDRASVPVGLAILWSGNVGMSLAIFTVYRRLARN